MNCIPGAGRDLIKFERRLSKLPLYRRHSLLPTRYSLPCASETNAREQAQTSRKF